MHPVSQVLSWFGLQLSKKQENPPKEFMVNYNQNLKELQGNSGGFKVFKELSYNAGIHPTNNIDYECGFAAYHISRLNPKNILDIGSYRHFILGMLSHFQVTTIDIRDRIPISSNEIVVTCDATNLSLRENEFDVVISLCALEHFGLGRYGDEFNFNADKEAFKEMIRVLKPGGSLIFTTSVTGAPPSIAFNAHRIYSHEMITAFCADLLCEDEKFYSHKSGDFCSIKEVTIQPNVWDVYCGCWKKKK